MKLRIFYIDSEEYYLAFQFLSSSNATIDVLTFYLTSLPNKLNSHTSLLIILWIETKLKTQVMHFIIFLTNKTLIIKRKTSKNSSTNLHTFII